MEKELNCNILMLATPEELNCNILMLANPGGT